VEQLATLRFDPATIRAHARTFDAAVFRRAIAAYVDECWRAHVGAPMLRNPIALTH
jgi:hypothetical protein